MTDRLMYSLFSVDHRLPPTQVLVHVCKNEGRVTMTTRVRTVENSGAFWHIYRGRGASMAIATPAHWCMFVCLCVMYVCLYEWMDVVITKPFSSTLEPKAPLLICVLQYSFTMVLEYNCITSKAPKGHAHMCLRVPQLGTSSVSVLQRAVVR